MTSDSESGPIPDPPGTDRRALVVWCWTQILGAAALFILSLIAGDRSPSIGMDWREDSGLVLAIAEEGPAHRAGIRAGDRIIAVDEITSASGLPLFYDIRAGEPIDIIVERSGRLEIVSLVPAEHDAQRGWTRESTTRLFSSLSDHLRTLVNIWFLLLGGLILAYRPRLGAARAAALAIACWVGGNSLIAIPGFGRMVEGWSPTAQFSLHLVDLLYSMLFLALMLHFAMLFPRAFPSVRKHPVWQIAPYLVVAPLIAASSINLLRFFYPGLRGEMTSVSAKHLFDFFGPLLLMIEAFLLTLQYRHTDSKNDRRRLTFVLASLIPGLTTWIVYIFLQYLNVSMAMQAFGRVFFWLGAALSAAIFAWAILRYRVFGMKLLVRKSIQYALARGTLLFLTALPIVVLAAFLYVRRYEPLIQVVSNDLFVLMILTIPTFILYQYRNRFLEFIDRHFFREEYDAHQALGRLASMIQRGTDMMFLGRLALTEIERALHPVHLSFWRLDRDAGMYRSVLALGQDAPKPHMDEQHALNRFLVDRGEPLQIDLQHPSGDLRRLSSEIDVWLWLGKTEAALIVPLVIEQELLGFILLGPRRSEEPYTQSDRDLLQSVAAQLALTEDYLRLEGLARVDPLTDALNRHAFYSLIEKPHGSTEELRSGCAAVVDLNDLKAINDGLGHGAGDIAIRQVASSIRSIVRADDLVFRWGGDEFLVILFGLGEGSVRERFSMLDSLFEASGIRETIPLSVSYGIAPFTDLGGISEAIDAADHEMYFEKQRVRRTNGASPH